MHPALQLLHISDLLLSVSWFRARRAVTQSCRQKQEHSKTATEKPAIVSSVHTQNARPVAESFIPRLDSSVMNLWSRLKRLVTKGDKCRFW